MWGGLRLPPSALHRCFTVPAHAKAAKGKAFSGRTEDLAGWWLAGALGVYLAVSLTIHHRVITELNSATTGRVEADSGLFTWWLAWLPYAVGARWGLSHRASRTPRHGGPGRR